MKAMPKQTMPREAMRKKTVAYIPPMKATLTKEHFSDAKWLYERKFDGQRCVAVKDGRQVTLYSRNQKVLNETYPELVTAIKKQPVDQCVIDGEIVAFAGNTTSFSRLQNRMKLTDPAAVESNTVAVYLYVFDLMHLGTSDLQAVPLETRKRLLKQAFDWNHPRLRFAAHRRGSGEKYLAEACQKGWEGLIAKRADSVYRTSRSRDWLKFKCVLDQEFVIGGYTKPHGERTGFGAILIGYYAGKKLRYAGKVGTGYDEETLADLKQRFADYEQKQSPFADPVDANETTCFHQNW